ncbi:MAG TPA: hypothetical protein VMJ93_00825 [Verrucomicrobiae bacterium]|nr:hypothetical protein [Verrucomicrobiae bacterium]
MSSNAGECGMNGGYFFPGYGNPATISIDSNGGLDPNTESAVTMSGEWNGSAYNLTMLAPQSQQAQQAQKSPCIWADVGALAIDVFALLQPELAPWGVSASAHAVGCNLLWEYNP